MPKRRKINQDAVATLQFRADLRCCLCQYVGDLPPRPQSGQIHHIDGDPSNSAIENLVWLCLEHHEEVGKIGHSSRRIHAKTIIRFVTSWRDAFSDKGVHRAIAGSLVVAGSRQLSTQGSCWMYTASVRTHPRSGTTSTVKSRSSDATQTKWVTRLVALY